MISTIPLASIDAANRLRTLDPSQVALLAEEIAVDGQTTTIRVVARGEGYRLIDGARRIAAHVQLGREEIEAQVEDEAEIPDDAAVRLAEIKGHMLRGELTALDRAVVVSAWCDHFKALHGTPRRGPKPKFDVVDGGSDEALDELSVAMTLNWSDAAQSALQIGRKTLFRHLKIARIENALRMRIGLHPIADSQGDLVLLAAQTPVRQNALVDLLTAEGSEITTVAAAIAAFDQVAASRPALPYERVQERFARLSPQAQEKFFELNEPAIEQWLAKRAIRPAAKRSALLTAV